MINSESDINSYSMSKEGNNDVSNSDGNKKRNSISFFCDDGYLTSDDHNSFVDGVSNNY